MTPTTTDAWTLARVVAVESLGDDLAGVSEAIRPLVAMLAAVPLEHRQTAFTAFLAGQPGADEIVMAMAQADPMGPPPVIKPPRRFATCADVMRLETTAPWTWKAWLPSARVVGIAAGEGVGKTRLAMDLARRVWHGEPWPDGQPMTLPPESPTLWVAADGQHTELAQSLPAMNMPPEAIIFPTTPDDPFGGVSLDEPETLEALGEAVRIHRPAFVVVDSLTYATRSDIGEQRAIATLKDPLVTLAQAHQIIVMLLLHVSREGQALGRRIRGITRTLMHLECPDPSQADRLRLWVEKSYAAKPPALGVTIGESGNTYDSSPPTRMDPSKGGRPPGERERPAGSSRMPWPSRTTRSEMSCALIGKRTTEEAKRRSGEPSSGHSAHLPVIIREFPAVPSPGRGSSDAWGTVARARPGYVVETDGGRRRFSPARRPFHDPRHSSAARPAIDLGGPRGRERDTRSSLGWRRSSICPSART